MSRVAIPIAVVGNEFALPQTQLHVIKPKTVYEPEAAIVSAPLLAAKPEVPLPEPIPDSLPTHPQPSLLNRVNDFIHHYSLAVFALLFLAVGVAAVEVGGNYWSEHIISRIKPATALKSNVHTIAGLNLTVPTKDLQSKLQNITGQPASLTVGTHNISIEPETIKSWLQITSNANKSESYLRIKAGSMEASLQGLANQFAKTPVNQVTVTESGVDRVVVGGRDGTALSDPGSLKSQSQQLAKTVMDGKGLQFNTPLAVVPFQAVTPAAFDKLLDVNLITKQMYAYQNGQLVQTFAVSAGAPITPTPIGQFRVYAKFAVQDMRGFNPDGSKYFQPKVPWVNYFTAGNAVHGNYWRPASVFGSVNTSHGCVSVPVNQAKWVYDWAPIGTTVIVHI